MIFLRTFLGLGRLAAAAVRRLLGPVVGVVSLLGWIVLLAALASALVAGLFGWSEFLYLGLTLSAGLVVSAFFLIGHASFRVEIELSPRRVIAGERAFGRLLVTNTGARRSSATRLELPVGRGEADFSVPPLAPAGSGAAGSAGACEHEELFAVPTARRAVITAGPALSVRGDQLGLLRRRVRWADPVELFVHPVTTLLAPSQSGLVRDLEGAVTSTLTNSDLEFHALRPYEPGDDQRSVHWRASARSGQLMVRQFQETRRSELVLAQLVDATGYAQHAMGTDLDDAGTPEFELAVSVMASVGAQVLREKTRARVVTETLELRTATVTTLLDDSCRLEPMAGLRLSPREFIRDVLARTAPPSVLVVVTGSQTPIGELRAIEAVVGSDTRLIGLRVELGGEPRISQVSRVHLLTIGELGDLPRLLRRVS
ncbi:MAG TPA: DUF58 domain-containing protein [Pseudolysinimonas sp.]|nr:DUF58 domain-containing protein [Pseudolysinimonas sp.]